jgi:hypothetical protein
MEQFRPIVGYEGLYEVGDLGTVVACEKIVPVGITGAVDRRGRKSLKPSVHPHGHLRVWLSKDGKKKAFLVHRLVAAAWIENPDHLPIVNHIDGDPAHNAASNLEWTTISGNTSHAFAGGKIVLPQQVGEANNRSRLTEPEIISMRMLFSECGNTAEVARRFGISLKASYDICHRQRWAHVL